MAFCPGPHDSQISQTVFGGLVTEMGPISLPDGVSPDCQDVVFVPGSVSSRPALRKVFSTPLPKGTASFVGTVTYGKSYVNANSTYNLYLDSNGDLWYEDVGNSPGTYTQLGSVAPGSYAKSVTAFGREYIAISDGRHGTDMAIQWDGTNLDRVTQDGPGAPPKVSSVALPSVAMATVAGPAPTPVTVVSMQTTDIVHYGPPYPMGNDEYSRMAITLAAPLALSPGDWVTITGTSNPTICDGNWMIAEVLSSTGFKAYYTNLYYSSSTGGTLASVGGSGGTTLVRSGNLVTCNTAAPHGLQPGFQAQITGVSAQSIGGGIVSVVVSNEDNPGIGTVTTTTAHGLTPGQFVSLVGVVGGVVGGTISSAARVGGLTTITATSPHGLVPGSVVVIAGSGATFNTTAVILSIPSPASFTFAQNDTDTSAGAGGTVTVAWPVPQTVTPYYFEVVTAPSPTTFQVQLNCGDGTWTSGSVMYAWDGIFFVQSILSATKFTYQQNGPDTSTDVVGAVTPWGQAAPGKHYCRVAFLTRQGYITRSSPPTYFTANGGQFVSVSDIAIGPPSVVARVLEFTGAEGSSYFYIPTTPQVSGQVVGTATQINDNTTTSVLLDFADPTLFAGIATSIPGNNIENQLVLDGALGFGFYGSRLVAWGMRNRLQSLLNLGFEGGTLPSATGTPAGWTLTGSGSLVTGAHGIGKAWQTGTTATLSQGMYQDAYGGPIAQPNTKYRVRAWLAGAGSSAAFAISSASTSFSSTCTLVTGVAAGGWMEGVFSLPTPAPIPSDLVLTVTAGAATVTIDEISIIYDSNPYLETILYGSYVDNPEAFDGVSGKFGPSQDTHQIMDLGVIRQTLYVLTRDPSGRLHETNDNGVTEPKGWSFGQVAANCGLVSAFALTKSQADDASASGGEEWLAWASSTGARIFGGSEPWKISQEIQPNWDAIDAESKGGTWALNDPASRTLYFGVQAQSEKPTTTTDVPVPLTGKSPYQASFAATTRAAVIAGVDAAAVACGWGRTAITGGWEYILTSPQGLKVKLRVQDLGNTGWGHDQVNVTFLSASGSATSLPYVVWVYAGATMQVWANQCSIWASPVGTGYTNNSGVSDKPGVAFSGGVPYAYDTNESSDPTTELWWSEAGGVNNSSTFNDSRSSLRDGRLGSLFSCCRNGVVYPDPTASTFDDPGRLQISSPTVLAPVGNCAPQQQHFNGALTVPLYISWGSVVGQIDGNSSPCLRGTVFDAALRTLDAVWDTAASFSVGGTAALNWVGYSHYWDTGSTGALETGTYFGSMFLLSPFSGPLSMTVAEFQSVPMAPHCGSAQFFTDTIFKITDLPDYLTHTDQGALDIIRDLLVANGWTWTGSSPATQTWTPAYGLVYGSLGGGAGPTYWLDNDGLPFPLIGYDPAVGLPSGPAIDTWSILHGGGGSRSSGGWFGASLSLSGVNGGSYTGAWIAIGATSRDTFASLAAAISAHTQWDAVVSLGTGYGGRDQIILSHKFIHGGQDPNCGHQNVWAGLYGNSWDLGQQSMSGGGGYWLMSAAANGPNALVGTRYSVWVRPVAAVGDSSPTDYSMRIGFQVFIDAIDAIDLPALAMSDNFSQPWDTNPWTIYVTDYQIVVVRHTEGDAGVTSQSKSLIISAPFVPPERRAQVKYLVFATHAIRDSMNWASGLIALNQPHPDRISWGDLNLCPLAETGTSVPGVMGLRCDSRIWGGTFALTANQGQGVVQEARLVAPGCTDLLQGQLGHEITGNSATGTPADIMGLFWNMWVSSIPSHSNAPSYGALAQIKGRRLQRLGSQFSDQFVPGGSSWIDTGIAPDGSVPSLGISVDDLQPQPSDQPWIWTPTVARTVGHAGGANAAPNIILVCSYRELDTASQIAASAPIHTSYTGRLIATDHTRKWSLWNVSANGAALMYRDPESLSVVLFGGNGQPLGAANGTGNVYTLDPTLLTDDDYGQIYPYYTTFFMPSAEQEIQLQLGGTRKMLVFVSAFVSGVGHLTVTPLCNAIANAWSKTIAWPLPANPTYDMEWGGGQALGQRIALKLASSPAAGTDNSFTIQRLAAWMRRVAHLPVRGKL